MAVGTGQGTVAVVDVQRWQVVRTIAAHTPGFVAGIAISPDGTLVASGAQDGVAVHELATGRRRYGLNRGSKFVVGVAFSPDGRLLAAGFSDGSAVLLDARTGRERGGPLVFNRGAVGGMAFTPDGRLLAAGQGDGSVQLVNVATRQRIGEGLRGQTDQVVSVAFTPDGQRLAASSYDGTVVLYDTSAARWSKLACSLAGRNLSRAEWKQYLGDRAYHRTCSQWPAGK